jgi:hypothetical protein
MPASEHYKPSGAPRSGRQNASFLAILAFQKFFQQFVFPTAAVARPGQVSLRSMMFSPTGPHPQWSRRGIMALAATLMVASAFVPSPVWSAHGSTEAGAKAFIDSIYQRYVGNSSGGAKGIPLASAGAVRSYFTVGLASLIIEDRTTASRRGEPPVLEGDPFVGRQDWDIANLAVEVKDTGALKATATVNFTDSGKPGKVVLELLRSGKEWRIADIEWESGTLRGLYRRKAAQDNEAAGR